MHNLNHKKNFLLISLFKTSVFAAFVAFAIALIVVYVKGLDSPQKWKTPPNYRGDGIFMINLLKAAEKNELKPFANCKIKNLGAPYSAEIDDWPLGIGIEWVVGGFLSRIFGIAVASNLLVVLAHMLAGVCMFFSLRLMCADLTWASLSGLAFGLSPFLFSRAFEHFNLTSSVFIIPAICAASYYLFKYGIKQRLGIPFWSIGCFSFILGGMNPYWTFPFLVVIAFAFIYWCVNTRCIVPNWPFLALPCFFVIGFLVWHAPHLIKITSVGKNYMATERAYSNLQQFALRPIEMFLPGSGSEMPLLKQMSAFYENQDLFRRAFDISESMTAYIGLPSIVGFILLSCFSIYHVMAGSQNKISPWFWFALFFMAFSVVGGLNGILGLGKFYFLRSSNRYSVYIVAISLIYLALLLTDKCNHLNRLIKFCIFIILIAITVVEPIIPRIVGRSNLVTSDKFASDQKFVTDISKKLKSGAMLFSYPVIEFPERGSYAHLRPALFSEKLHFSFADMVGRARSTWQNEILQLPILEMVEKLKSYGFSGIVIYKGEDLTDEPKMLASEVSDFFKQNQFSGILSSSADFEFFAFDPNPTPVFPSVLPMYVNNWWSTQIRPPDFVLNSAEVVSVWRWATHTKALVEVFNEQDRLRSMVISGRVVGAIDCELQILVHGKPVFTGMISPDAPCEFSTVPIDVAAHTAIRLEFKSNRKPVVLKGRKFSFAVAQLKTIWK